jgi:hypothetical protein
MAISAPEMLEAAPKSAMPTATLIESLRLRQSALDTCVELIEEQQLDATRNPSNVQRAFAEYTFAYQDARMGDLTRRWMKDSPILLSGADESRIAGLAGFHEELMDLQDELMEELADAAGLSEIRALPVPSDDEIHL